MRILFGLFLLACSAASLTTIEVRTEGFGIISAEVTGVQNLNGAMVWNGTTWVVNNTWAHKYFIDTRTGTRLKSYTTRNYQGAAPPPDTFGIYTVQPTLYTYQKTAATGVYRFQAIEYRIRNQASGRHVVLRSRGTQAGTANSYFDIYIEDEVAAGAPPQTTAFRGDPVWFTYPLSLDQALLQTSPTTSRTGLLPTAGGDYYLDYGGGADLGPHGEGRSIQFQTATVPVADPALTLGSVFTITVQYKWMDDAGNLFEMRFTPYAEGTFTPNATCTFSLSAPSATLQPIHGGTVVALTASAPTCAWTAANPTSWLTLDSSGGTGSALLTVRAADNPSASPRAATLTIAGQTLTLTQTGLVLPTPARFVPLMPCRLVETRAEYNFQNRTGPFGPPFFTAGETRTIALPNSTVCPGIPASARAFVLNVTAVPKGSLDTLTVYPGGESRPDFYTLRSPEALIVANSAIVPAGPGGTLSLYASHATDIIIDISGYFTADTTAANLAFYPMTPCRVIDTRAVYRSPAGPFGPPSLAAQQIRTFRFPDTPYCTIPRGAAAYSVTITVAPPAPLAFLTAWPAGGTQPPVSSLNSLAGRIVANSVILPASSDGSVSLYPYNATDVIVDINGYFAPDDGTTGLFYYPLRQTRILDTTVTGAIFSDETQRTLTIPAPSQAKAYALNATVIPDGNPMPYATLWPTGQTRPNASIINAFEGQTVSSGFLVPAGTNGTVEAFTYRRTHLILEIAGYFAR